MSSGRSISGCASLLSYRAIRDLVTRTAPPAQADADACSVPWIAYSPPAHEWMPKHFAPLLACLKAHDSAHTVTGLGHFSDVVAATWRSEAHSTFTHPAHLHSPATNIDKLHCKPPGQRLVAFCSLNAPLCQLFHHHQSYSKLCTLHTPGL